MKPLVAMTYRMTRDRDSAVDLAQDACVAAWQKLHTFRGESKFESWLFSIAINKARNFLQSRALRATDNLPSEMVDQSSDVNPETELTRSELRRDVFAFMQSLPEQQQVAFNLRFYRQLSFDEIAKATGRALGTVKTNYREAVKKLREFALEKGWR